MTVRRKARLLAAIGVFGGWCACGYSFIWPGYWWVGLFKLTVFGLTCALGGITWWTTRPVGSDS